MELAWIFFRVLWFTPTDQIKHLRLTGSSEMSLCVCERVIGSFVFTWSCDGQLRNGYFDLCSSFAPPIMLSTGSLQRTLQLVFSLFFAGCWGWLWVFCKETACHFVLSAQLLWGVRQRWCHDERWWDSHVLVSGNTIRVLNWTAWNSFHYLYSFEDFLCKMLSNVFRSIQYLVCLQ